MVSIDPHQPPDPAHEDVVAGLAAEPPGLVGDGLAPPGPSPRWAGGSPAEAARHATAVRRAKVLLVLADLLTVSATVAAAALLGLVPGTTPAGDRILLVVLVGSWMVVTSGQRLYLQRVVQRPGQELRRISFVALGAALSVLTVAFLLELTPRRSWVLAVPVAMLVTMCIERMIARGFFRKLRARGALVRRVVLVGGSADLSMVLGDRKDLETGGYEVVAVVDVDEGGDAPERRVLQAVLDWGAGGILLTGNGMAPGVVRRLARLAHDSGIHVELLSPLHDVAAQRITVHAIGSTSALYLEQAARSGWRSAAKRAFDLVVASSILLVCLPLFVVVALAIKLDSPGPILYRQERVGRDFAPFRILKFRSMVVGAESLQEALRERNEADGPLFKLASDPRVTRVGRFLRTTSIDELPQLWNVVRGEMSMVGPRPGTPEEVIAWPEELAWRVRVTPGITGMWQVHGRSLTSFEDYTRLDLYYVDNWSLATDIVLLAKTVPVVLLRRGAF